MNRKEIRTWIDQHLTELYADRVDASVSDGELVLIGRLTVDVEIGETDAMERIRQHREESRPRRMALAQELEGLTGLAVAWGVRCVDVTAFFSSRRVPVMTRLGAAERSVLDTLILGGIVGNRSQAVGWAIRAFARGRRKWLRELNEAVKSLRDVREEAEGEETFEPEDLPAPQHHQRPRGASGSSIVA